jgi:hypothetical protein
MDAPEPLLLSEGVCHPLGIRITLKYSVERQLKLWVEFQLLKCGSLKL